MRKVKEEQLRLGAVPISKVEIDLDSRDEISQLLLALQRKFLNITPQTSGSCNTLFAR